jgi:integrase/recombinase XerD
MKQLQIKTTHFLTLQKSFKDWLQIMGYADGTVETFPVHLREFFHYLEERNVFHIRDTQQRHYDGFISYLQIRTNKQQKAGGLSTSSINKIAKSVNTFAKYINQNGRFTLSLTPKYLQNSQEIPKVLTLKEIKVLYEASFMPHRLNTVAIGQRDRAILAIFYGCGLRKSEGAALNIGDVDLTKRTVFVRKGKGNKQRYVPIVDKALDDIKAYLEEGRYWFLEYQLQGSQRKNMVRKSDSTALFINQFGGRMQDFYHRFKCLRIQSEMDKHFSTHTFRHSIATHLLQSGMDIEEIAKFLGHSSLESTQIYTHITQDPSYANL